jgi:hypothetical protein
MAVSALSLIVFSFVRSPVQTESMTALEFAHAASRGSVRSRQLLVEVTTMYVRVVRFTDVSAERVEGLVARIKESDAPPPGVPGVGLKMLHDEEQGTAVVLQYFATAEDMDAGGRAFGAMDAAETPGTRASVDTCEVKLEVEAP